MPLLACKRHTTLAKNPLIFIPLFLFLPVFFLSPSISELTPNSYSGRQYYHESTHFLLDFFYSSDTEDHQNDKIEIFMTLTPKQKVGVRLGDESFSHPTVNEYRDHLLIQCLDYSFIGGDECGRFLLFLALQLSPFATCYYQKKFSQLGKVRQCYLFIVKIQAQLPNFQGKHTTKIVHQIV